MERNIGILMVYLHFTCLSNGNATQCHWYNETFQFDCRFKGLKECPLDIPNSAETVLLSDNSISSCDPQAFGSLWNLKQLYLSNNNLKTIRLDLFKNSTGLVRIYLQGNPFICDCALALALLPIKKVIRFGYCSEPSDMKGKKLSKLNQGEVCVCNASTTGNTTIKGIFHWPVTSKGVKAIVKCPYNKSESATRLCNKNAVWEIPNDSACPFNGLMNVCNASTTGNTTIKGIFHWPVTSRGVKAIVKCPYNESESATRLCNKNAVWEIPNDSACPFNGLMNASCKASQTGEVNIKGIFHWPKTVSGMTAYLACPFGPKNITATRLCNSNAVWKIPNDTGCQYKSSLTNDLRQLAKVKVTNSDALNVSIRLDYLMNDPSIVSNVYDIIYATEVIEHVLNAKTDNASKFQVTPLILNVTGNIIDVSPNITVGSQLKQNTSNRILSALQRMANDVPLPTNKSSLVISKHRIAMGIDYLDKQEKLNYSLLIKASKTYSTGYNDLSFKKSQDLELDVEDFSSLFISESLLSKVKMQLHSKEIKISVFLFDKSTLFRIKQGSKLNMKEIINSKIISVAINGTELNGLTDEEELQSAFRPQISVQKRQMTCVFWNFTASGGMGNWSAEGCRTDGIEDGFYKCRCNHLTNFAILMDLDPPFNKAEALALSYVTYIGCAISLVGLVFTLVTFIVFKNLRQKLPSKILICLCMSLTAALVVFLSGTTIKTLIGCKAFAVLLHYFILTSFSWMAVEGFNLYIYFVKVMIRQVPGFFWKANIFAWGLPFVIVAVSAGATQMRGYCTEYDNQYICMPIGDLFYIAYLTLILLIIFCNWIVLALVLRNLSKQTAINKNQKTEWMSRARIAIGCSILMGLTWTIGLFAVVKPLFTLKLLFCIVNSLQGFFICVFYCLRNKDARREWLKFCGYQGNKYRNSEDKSKKNIVGMANAGIVDDVYVRQ